MKQLKLRMREMVTFPLRKPSVKFKTLAGLVLSMKAIIFLPSIFYLMTNFNEILLLLKSRVPMNDVVNVIIFIIFFVN